MRIYNGFILVVATVVFLVLGAGLIFTGAGVFEPRDLTPLFQQNSLAVLVFGMVFLLLGILELFLGMKSLNRIPAVAFSNPLGEVRIAYDALEDYVRSLSSEIPEIKDAKPQVLAGREGLEIRTRLIVERDVNIPEVTSRFQDLVSRYVKDVMGIENVSAIKVYIQKISSRKSRVSKEEVDIE